MARAVHGARLFVATLLPIVLMMMLVGCVIPPSLEPEADGGVNSPPAILSVRTEQRQVQPPEAISVARGPQAGNLTITLLDTDVGDQLYVGLFVDYNLPDELPPRSTCSAAPNGGPQRIATCSMTSVCALADIDVQRHLTIMVADRPTVPNVEPLFQALEAGGRSTREVYFLACKSPST